MTPRGLTLLAPLRPGASEPLTRVLRSIGDDIQGRRLSGDPHAPHIHFPRSGGIHFARMAIVEGDARGGPPRLLYSANHDGSLEQHLAELVSLTPDMDAIWGGCVGYRGVEHFPDFVRAHARTPDAFYMAFREGRVEEIRRRIPSPEAPAPLAFPPPGPSFMDRLRALGRGAPIVLDVALALARYGFGNVWWASRTITATLDRYPLIHFVNRVTGNRLPPLATRSSSAPLEQEVRRVDPVAQDLPPSYREDAVAQNQLTLLTRIEPGQVLRLRAVLAAIDAYATRLSPPGSLTGISTIHFVRWLVLDDDRRLLMLSDYDGSWENYIDEFAEMILSGLDAIWGGATGAPPGGARDLPALKHFLRSHQFPSLLFYSGYPRTTTLNIVDDRIRESQGARRAL